MQVTINQVLIEQEKSIYWLAKQVDCDYQSLKRLVQNETTSISFNLLQEICICLNCTPNQILKVEE